jgi:hypothetical protein
VSAGKPGFDAQEEKKGYSYVNCYPFERIPGNCKRTDQERNHIDEVPIEAISGRVFYF